MEMRAGFVDSERRLGCSRGMSVVTVSDNHGVPLYSPIATQIDHHLTHHGPQQNSHDFTAIANRRDRLPAAFDSELRARPQHILARAAAMAGKKRVMSSPKPKGSIAEAMFAETDWKKGAGEPFGT